MTGPAPAPLSEPVCGSCIGQAEAALERAATPLSPVQDGGFWDGFRFAQKVLRDLREPATNAPRAAAALPTGR